MARVEASRLHEKGEPRLVGGQLYSMLDIMGHTVTCDRCGRWQRLESVTEMQARIAAGRKGWTRHAGMDLCPICSKPAKAKRRGRR